MKVLFVCTGNTCRSPMAQAMLARGLEAAGLTNIEVESAGTGARDGSAASEGAYLVMLERGYDLSGHRARTLSHELVREADLILAMGRTHLARVRELGGGPRVHLLSEFSGQDAEGGEIQDPFGTDLDAYRETFRNLSGMLPAVVRRLGGGA